MARKPSIVASLQAELVSQRERYKSYLTRRCEDGNFFHFFRDYLKVMSLEEAAVLQSIVNMGRGNATADGWILCTDTHLEKSLGIKRRARDRIVGRLVGKSFLTTRLRGNPARRQVRPDLIAVEEAVDAVSVCTEPYKLVCTPGEQTRSCRTVRHKEKKTSSSKRKGGGASGASPPRHPPSAVADVTVLPGKSSTPAGVPVPVASPDGKEPVYDEYASKPRNPPGKVHLEMAASLLDYFKTAGRYPGRYDQKKWARELRSVAEFVGSDDTVWSVIEYLSTSHGAAWPTIGNTNQFCQRFDDLHQLMTKRVGVTVPDQPPAVQTVIQQCQEFLPAKAHPTLPACVTVSVVTVREFITGLSHLKDCHRPSKAGRVNATENYYRTEVLGHLLAKLTRDKPDVTVLRGVLRVVLDWVRFVGEKVRGWESWSGNMKGYAFALDHKDFPEFWERVLFQGDRKWLDRVRKELGE